MDIGYDPERVRALSHRTADAINGLHSIRSDDPAAADALRTVRLTRSNLEILWMPTLLQIVRSDAMVSWTALHPMVGWRSAMSLLTDDVLLGYVTWADPLPPNAAALDKLDLDALARELARRVAQDPAFADRVLALAPSTTIIGDLTRRADFPPKFLADVVTAMMWPRGLQATYDFDGHAASLSNAMAALLDHPAVCLDLLLDPAVLYGIAGWELLDVDIVREFTLAGLYDAVAADPGRLGDGYEVIARLTMIANGPLDRGLHPGLTIGFAGSMAGYLPTLAPALNFEGNTRSVVIIDDVEIDLGTYDDLVGLFGLVLHEPSAQAAIAPFVSEYATQTVTDLGADVGTRTGVEHVADFADLLVDATRAKQRALMAEAAAEEGRRRQLAGALGFGLSAVGGPTARPAVRVVVEAAVQLGTELVDDVEPKTMPDGLFGPTTYNLITMAAVAVVVNDPSVRRQLGMGSISPRQLGNMARRLDDIADETDLTERVTKVRKLEQWIAAEVPALDAHLNTVKTMPGMDALKEGA
ncbi:MAG TPA: hypothetical protein VES40_04155 [Ilumatobacteraceae bacterium]|nr:hypothetical protein [Ilumatobacteraceae bacterium]